MGISARSPFGTRYRVRSYAGGPGGVVVSPYVSYTCELKILLYLVDNTIDIIAAYAIIGHRSKQPTNTRRREMRKGTKIRIKGLTLVS